jgi:uncharacterized membrane protein
VKADVAAYKEMIRVIRSLFDTRDSCLKLKAYFYDENVGLMVYNFIYWDGDVKNRISVTGFIISLLGVPICWF